MTGELVKQQTAVAQQPRSLLEAIATAVQAPNIDVAKMAQLVELQISIQKREAEIAFNDAMARLQPKLPRIRKDGAIVVSGQTRSRYMRYEDIDIAIRPLLGDEGLSLSFDTQLQDNKVVVYGKVSHRLGHSETKSIPLPIENSGSKNPTQAIGSTVQYGKRYLVTMIFNLVAEGEDDDGRGGSEVITDDQRKKLWALIKESNSIPEKFMTWAGVAELDEILQRDYQKCIDMLNRKKGVRQ